MDDFQPNEELYAAIITLVEQRTGAQTAMMRTKLERLDSSHRTLGDVVWNLISGAADQQRIIRKLSKRIRQLETRVERAERAAFPSSNLGLAGLQRRPTSESSNGLPGLLRGPARDA